MIFIFGAWVRLRCSGVWGVWVCGCVCVCVSVVWWVGVVCGGVVAWCVCVCGVVVGGGVGCVCDCVCVCVCELWGSVGGVCDATGMECLLCACAGLRSITFSSFTM